jgi:DNA-binding CsgD family transcriptional regulator
MVDVGQRIVRDHQSLLEREAELGALDRALTDLCVEQDDPSRVRRGGLLVYSAPAGLGKTALLAEARRRAAVRGCTVLSARGGEQEQRLPFHVLRQLVQPLLAAIPEKEHPGVLGSWYDIVAPALGLVAARGGIEPDPTGVRDGLDWIMTRLAVKHGPLVLVLDDAHWADSESLGWLAAFVPRAEELSMLVVIGYRPDELPLQASHFRKIAARHGSRPFDLMPLTPGAVGRVVRDSLGEGSDDGFCRECWAVTGGNPFEIVELTAKILDRGLKAQQESIPELPQLAAAVKGDGLVERIARLGTSKVRFTWAAAVLGTEISASLAARLAAIGAEEAVDVIERLRQERILTRRSGPDTTLGFAHPLVATAIYRAIPGAFRVSMHGEAARAVVDAGLGATAASRHLLETQPEGDPWVVHQLREAAREYLRSGAPEAARRCLDRALREPPPFDERAAVLYELGRSALLSEPTTTVNHLRAALEEPTITPALRESVTYRLAQALAHSDRMAEAAQVVAQEAQRAASHRSRLRMQAEQFMYDAFRADEQDSPARSRRLARLAGHLTGRALPERYILGLRAWDAVVKGEPATTAVRFAEEALGTGLSWTDDDYGFELPVMVALTFMYCDQPGRAEALFIKGIAELERKGWRGAHLLFGFSLLGYIRYRRGRLAAAENVVREGLRIADRAGQSTPARWSAVGVLIEILLARGRTEEARELADESSFGDVIPNAVVYPDSQTVFSEILLAQGLNTQAERHLTAVGSRLEGRGMRNPAWCPWQLHLADAVAYADPARATTITRDALERARQFGTETAIGQALHASALATSGPEQMKLLADAVRHLERSPSSYELARALVGHGAALRRAGLAQDAADQLHRGLESAVNCGADPLAASAREELAAAGLRPLQLLSDGTDALSAQEQEVAEQAVLGHSTARIAEGRGMTERSVTAMLSTVYRKVGTDHAGLAKVLSHGTYATYGGK